MVYPLKSVLRDEVGVGPCAHSIIFYSNQFFVSILRIFAEGEDCNPGAIKFGCLMTAQSATL